MRSSVSELFPSPVIEYNIGRNFTEKELQFMFNSELTENISNLSSLNKFILNSKELKDIKSFIIECINDYIDAAILPKYKLTPYITESWINVTKKGEAHHSHTHPNSIISGVLYISTDPEKDKIVFHRKNDSYILNIESENFNKFNSYVWWMPAKPGVMYLFPSTLPHEVEKTTSEVVRVSLSFNTFIKGIIDTYKSRALTLE